MSYSTLPQALDELSRLDRTIRLINRKGELSTIRFAELRERALHLLHHFQSRGVQAGEEMLLVLNRSDAFLDAYWACLYGAIVPVPLAPGVADEQRRKILRITGALARPRLFTEHALAARLAGQAREYGQESEHQRLQGRTIMVEDVGPVAESGKALDIGPDHTAFIQFSSGSTSDPKGVVLSHRNLLTNIRDMIDTAGLRDNDRGLSWMPLTHDMGLIGFHLMMVLAGMEHTIIATEAFIRRPIRWIRAASDYGATVLCSPNFGFRYLLKSFDPLKARDIDLSPVRIIFNGAEPISARLCEQFLDALAPNGLRRTAMYPVYGLAEASLAVSFPTVGVPYRAISVNRTRLTPGDRVEVDDRRNPMTLVSVGRPIGQCRVRIGDDTGRETTPGTVGRVLIRGPNVTGGFYVDGRSINREAFDAQGWLDTGDLGFIHDGDLYITGRTKDVIFVNGQNYYAHDIESVLAGVEGLELGKVVAAGCTNNDTDVCELVLFVQFRGDASSFEELARVAGRKVNERTSAPVGAAVPVKNIPKTTSGKLRRFSLQEAYERGDFRRSAVRLSQTSEVRSRAQAGTGTEAVLRDLFSEVLDGVAIGRDDSLFDIGASSLKLIELHERIDERFPGRIEAADLLEYPTLAKLAERLEGGPGN